MIMNERKILITGAGGFIGRHLVEHLNERVKVVAAYRQAPTDTLVESFSMGSISSHTDWSEPLKEVEAVIHLAALAHKHVADTSETDQWFTEVNVNAAVNLFRQSEQAGVKRFVFISSIGVIGNQTTDKPFSEESDCHPDGAYARSKYQAEKALQQIASQSSTELVIVRPPLVFSPSAPGNIAKLSRLIRVLPVLPFGSVRNRKSFISIENLMDVLERCIFSAEAAGQIFVVADNKVWSMVQLIQVLSQAQDRKVLLLPVPVALIRLGLRVLGKSSLSNQLIGDLVVDNTKARTRLYWEPVE